MSHRIQLLDLFSTKPSFDNFIVSSNIKVLEALKSYSHQFVHISGANLSGKTHLLNAWVNEKSNKAILITQDSAWTVDDLVEKYSYIAFDDVDLLLDTQHIALFDLFNCIKIRSLPIQLLTSSRIPLDKTNIRDDLKTRLLSGVNLVLDSIDDEDLSTALLSFCNDCGINVTRNEIQYLINHYTRSIGFLIGALKELDNVAMRDKRMITIPLIKRVFDIHQKIF